MEVPTGTGVKFIEEVPDSVCPKDLVGYVRTQHDVALILQNGCDEPWPQLESRKVCV